MSSEVEKAAVSRIPAPVIAIDGPSGSGKGTIAHRLAARLGFHVLDSGSLYRLLGLAAQQHGVRMDNEAGLQVLAAHLDVQFSQTGSGDGVIVLEGEDVTSLIRTEEIGRAASQVAALPAVRQALLQRQQAFREAPGLVADGRDMGTIIFPGAPLKIFLTASVEQRASRRYNQLISRGISANIDSLLAELQMRDARDQNRTVAPLKPAEDAVLLDNSGMSVDECVEFVLEAWNTHRS